MTFYNELVLLSVLQKCYFHLSDTALAGLSPIIMTLTPYNERTLTNTIPSFPHTRL